MLYQTMTVVVEGALAEEHTVTDYLVAAALLDDIEADAKASGYWTQVFVLDHYHSLDMEGECVCAQYATDLRPDHEFNSPH